MATTTPSEVASQRRADGKLPAPRATPTGRTSQGLIINMRLVFPICRMVIAPRSAAKYSRNRRASGPLRTNERSMGQAIAKPAATPKAKTHGATDSLTKRKKKLKIAVATTESESAVLARACASVRNAGKIGTQASMSAAKVDNSSVHFLASRQNLVTKSSPRNARTAHPK